MQRANNRANKELRDIKFTRNFTRHAHGSVLTEFGDTKVIVTATIEERQPRWLKDSGQGWLTAEYSLLPSSTNTRVSRDRGMNLSGRTQEIQRLIGRSLRGCIDLTKIGERTITIDADVIQADGGTRTASISGGFVALCDAVQYLLDNNLIQENPIIGNIGAISAGLADNEVLLDLDYSEDSTAQADCNVVMNNKGEIIEFQSTAEGAPFSKEQLVELLDTCEAGIKKIFEIQNETLRNN
ncbi:MAG: ribonuclease PH [Candidatus Gastranaerophilales bacterium]|nr:ribonuclease PH [Candidatus Gastranaerophilales bacterium]